MIKSGDGRALFTQRLLSRGGGFRAVTLKSWPADKLAREIVRMKAEQPEDELNLLHTLYVELEPAIQITFLNAAGVKHENGVMPADLEAPYASEEKVQLAAKAVIEQHGEDGARYIHTLAKYSVPGWPGIEAVAAGIA